MTGYVMRPCTIEGPWRGSRWGRSGVFIHVEIQMLKKHPSEKVKWAGCWMCGLVLRERAPERALRAVDIWIVIETSGRISLPRETIKQRRVGPRTQPLMATERSRRSWQMKPRRERQVVIWRAQGHTGRKEKVWRKKQTEVFPADLAIWKQWIMSAIQI